MVSSIQRENERGTAPSTVIGQPPTDINIERAQCEYTVLTNKASASMQAGSITTFNAGLEKKIKK